MSSTAANTPFKVFTSSLDDLYYNQIKFAGPFNDVTPGAPSYVRIMSLEIRQLGKYVQFIWEGDGNLFNNENQYYFLIFDTDLNPNTGQNWGGSGGELKIGVYHSATLVYFDAAGNVVNEVNDQHVYFEGNRFYLTLAKSVIPSDNFNLYFESSGGTLYICRGDLKLVDLQSSRGDVELYTTSDSDVLSSNPHLVNIASKDTPVKLHTFLRTNNSSIEIPPSDLTYSVTHHVSKITNASSIISIDSNGYAHYLSEGYVSVYVIAKSIQLPSDKEIIIATGKAYGDISKDDVIAVFPENYGSGSNTFGGMMNNYPNYMRMVNIAYNVTSEMYRGYRPFNGDRQIFALLVMPGYHAGGNMNPLETSPDGYMDYGSGQPDYNVVIHEMGHNFASTLGMTELTGADNHIIGGSGFGEGVASLPVIYIAKDLYQHPEKYGIKKSDFEWRYYDNFLQNDIPYSKNQLANFEVLVKSGQVKGIFDNGGKFDGVAAFCSLFQQYVYEFTTDNNTYKQEVIPRFLSLFPDKEPYDFNSSRVQTYFAAAFSAAVGHDIRAKLSDWGFDINVGYYDELYPVLLARTNREPYIQLEESKVRLTNLSGRNATLAVKLNNVGYGEGNYTLDVLVNGVASLSKTIRVPADSSMNTTLHTVVNRAGVNIVDVNGVQIEIEVPKTLSSLSLAASTENLDLGGSVTLDVKLTVPNASITLTIVKPSASISHVVTTDSNGSYRYTLNPDELGDWSATASWDGNENTVGSRSSKIIFTVNQPLLTSTLKITVKANEVAVVGATIYSLSQPAGQGVLTGTTDANGAAIFTDIKPGSYTIKVSKAEYNDENETIAVTPGVTLEKIITIKVDKQVSGSGGNVPGAPEEAVALGLILGLLFCIYLRKRMYTIRALACP